MGGNEIILLCGDQVPKGKEIQLAQKLLSRPNIRGHQTGFFYKLEKGGDLKVKIAEIGESQFIPMCGGLTQVLGVALLETDFAEHFGIKVEEPTTKITLETDVGFIPLEIVNKAGTVTRVWTHMKAYVDYCYKLGVQPVRMLGIDAMKVGYYLFVNGDAVKNVYDDVDFEEMNEFNQSSPESHFTQQTICSIATKNGRVSLSDNFLTIIDEGSKRKIKVISPEDFHHKLWDHFGIQLN